MTKSREVSWNLASLGTVMASTVLNGPGTMYKLRPYFDRSVQIELPTCMYKLPSFYEFPGDYFEVC